MPLCYLCSGLRGIHGNDAKEGVWNLQRKVYGIRSQYNCQKTFFEKNDLYFNHSRRWPKCLCTGATKLLRQPSKTDTIDVQPCRYTKPLDSSYNLLTRHKQQQTSCFAKNCRQTRPTGLVGEVTFTCRLWNKWLHNFSWEEQLQIMSAPMVPHLWWPVCVNCTPLFATEKPCGVRNFKIPDAPAYSCDAVTTTATQGYISSPFYPRNYPNNARCIWKIQASNGQVSNETVFSSLILTSYFDLFSGVFFACMAVTSSIKPQPASYTTNIQFLKWTNISNSAN